MGANRYKVIFDCDCNDPFLGIHQSMFLLEYNRSCDYGMIAYKHNIENEDEEMKCTMGLTDSAIAALVRVVTISEKHMQGQWTEKDEQEFRKAGGW